MSLQLYQYYVVTWNPDNTLDYEAGPFDRYMKALECKREYYKNMSDVYVFESRLEGMCL